MNKLQHPSNNRVLGAPKGWDQKELPCAALAVTDILVNGQQAIASFWQPDAEELAHIAAGAPIMLSVLGTSMPPVLLTVGAQ